MVKKEKKHEHFGPVYNFLCTAMLSNYSRLTPHFAFETGRLKGKRHECTTILYSNNTTPHTHTHWANDFICHHSGDTACWMGDLCFGAELIFSSNRIMGLLLFPIQSVTISFVQDQVTGTLLCVPEIPPVKYREDTHTHTLSLTEG